MKPSPYAGFNSLDESRTWEDRTREVASNQLPSVPEIRFFTEREVATLNAIVYHILPQDDRKAEVRLPITPFIDQVLFDGALSAQAGRLRPDPSRPGLGLELETARAEQFRVA